MSLITFNALRKKSVKNVLNCVIFHLYGTPNQFIIPVQLLFPNLLKPLKLQEFVKNSARD